MINPHFFKYQISLSCISEWTVLLISSPNNKWLSGRETDLILIYLLSIWRKLMSEDMCRECENDAMKPSSPSRESRLREDVNRKSIRLTEIIVTGLTTLFAPPPSALTFREKIQIYVGMKNGNVWCESKVTKNSFTPSSNFHKSKIKI